MFCWRITKYDPRNRDSKGFYLKDEWTSYSDIEKFFGDNKCRIDDYLNIENAYIQAIIVYMECTNTESLVVSELQKNSKPKKDEFYSESMLTAYVLLKKGQVITKEEVELVAKLTLRENIWCKLGAKDMYVHFGYDYYMYIGSTKPCEDAIKKIEKTGLFVESFESPLL